MGSRSGIFAGHLSSSRLNHFLLCAQGHCSAGSGKLHCYATLCKHFDKEPYVDVVVRRPHNSARILCANGNKNLAPFVDPHLGLVKGLKDSTSSSVPLPGGPSLVNRSAGKYATKRDPKDPL